MTKSLGAPLYVAGTQSQKPLEQSGQSIRGRVDSQDKGSQDPALPPIGQTQRCFPPESALLGTPKAHASAAGEG